MTSPSPASERDLAVRSHLRAASLEVESELWQLSATEWTHQGVLEAERCWKEGQFHSRQSLHEMHYGFLMESNRRLEEISVQAASLPEGSVQFITDLLMNLLDQAYRTSVEFFQHLEAHWLQHLKHVFQSTQRALSARAARDTEFALSSTNFVKILSDECTQVLEWLASPCCSKFFVWSSLVGQKDNPSATAFLQHLSKAQQGHLRQQRDELVSRLSSFSG